MSNTRYPVPVPPAPSAAASGILRVNGTSIVDQAGVPVTLEGAGLGAHLNMENCTPDLFTPVSNQVLEKGCTQTVEG